MRLSAIWGIAAATTIGALPAAHAGVVIVRPGRPRHIIMHPAPQPIYVQRTVVVEKPVVVERQVIVPQATQPAQPKPVQTAPQQTGATLASESKASPKSDVVQASATVITPGQEPVGELQMPPSEPGQVTVVPLPAEDIPPAVRVRQSGKLPTGPTTIYSTVHYYTKVPFEVVIPGWEKPRKTEVSGEEIKLKYAHGEVVIESDRNGAVKVVYDFASGYKIRSLFR